MGAGRDEQQLQREEGRSGEAGLCPSPTRRALPHRNKAWWMTDQPSAPVPPILPVAEVEDRTAARGGEAEDVEVPREASAQEPQPAPPVVATEAVANTDVQPECVKVCVRVRPLNSKEQGEGSTICVKFPSNNSVSRILHPFAADYKSLTGSVICTDCYWQRPQIHL